MYTWCVSHCKLKFSMCLSSSASEHQNKRTLEVRNSCLREELTVPCLPSLPVHATLLINQQLHF
jgi:hypothetical protein